MLYFINNIAIVYLFRLLLIEIKYFQEAIFFYLIIFRMYFSCLQLFLAKSNISVWSK